MLRMAQHRSVDMKELQAMEYIGIERERALAQGLHIT